MTELKFIIRNTSLANGQYRIALRITKNRKSKIMASPYKCKKSEWDSMLCQFKKKFHNHVQCNMALLKIEEKGLKIINDFQLEEMDFTLSQFEEKFKGKESSKTTVSEFWLEKIQDLNFAGRVGNARVFKECYNSFFKFENNKNLLFREVSVSLLDKYVTYLRSNNNSDGGIGVKLRTIRALYNFAIKNGIVDEKYYPFNVFKISKFKAVGFKKALVRDEMKLMETIDVDKYPHFVDTKNYLIFSYYMGGMNFIDMMKLRWSDIQDDRIVYMRSKTKVKFTVKMLEPVQQIVSFYKNQNRSTNYVFPILLKEKLTPLQIQNRKHKTLRIFNTQLKEIAKIQGVSENVTSYVIRHSFATNLKFAGVSTDLIGQSMGHSDISVTNAYLKNFDDEVIDEVMSKLLGEPILKYAS